MIYLKSAIAGIVAVALAIAFMFMVIVMYGLIVLRPTGNEAVGWDPISLVRWRVWGVGALVLIFLTGFVWEFRRCVRS